MKSTGVFWTALVLCACGQARVPGWEVERVETGGALLTVWGSGPEDVWAVGGRSGQGLVLHNDGTGWQRAEAEADELLWSVYGLGPEDVYAVGEGGLILHYDGLDWQRIESGTDLPLYGVWGTSKDDLWIVGGDPTPSGGAVVLRGSRDSFQPIALPGALSPSALFKIYDGPLGIRAVGTDGTFLSFDGAAWNRELAPTEEPIYSLWGRSEADVYAVGGRAGGQVLHFDGRTWTRLNEAPLGYGLSGVYTAPEQPMIAVGPDGYILEIALDGAISEPQLPTMEVLPYLHGVWGDGEGRTYAVGGQLEASQDTMHFRSGVILRRE